jgi:hypothetical protein
MNEFLSTVNGTENLRVICDWNAVDGEAEFGKTLGEFGVGNRTEKEERQVEFCHEKSFVVANTLYMQQLRRRHMWMMPELETRLTTSWSVESTRTKLSFGRHIHGRKSKLSQSSGNAMPIEKNKIRKTKRQWKWDQTKEMCRNRIILRSPSQK